jgi:hypothetical protein
MIAYSAQTPLLIDFLWLMLILSVLIGLAIWLRNK